MNIVECVALGRSALKGSKQPLQGIFVGKDLNSLVGAQHAFKDRLSSHQDPA